MADLIVLPNKDTKSTRESHQRKRVTASKSVHLERVLTVVKQLSPKELHLLEPWFRSRQESLEIKRTQTVPEQRKWSVYYERWGCVSCTKNKTPHRALGFCLTCYLRVSQRIKEILKETERNS